MEHILITGTNRGLGLEFTRQMRAGCTGVRWMPSARSGRSLHTLQAKYPQRLSIVALDVRRRRCYPGVAHDTVHSQTESIDILINNAGIYSSHGSDEPLERLGKLSFEDA